MPDSVDDLRQKAATAHRILALTGSMNDSTGHVFVRIPGTNEMLARGRNATDISPRFVEPDAMRRVALDGTAAEDLRDYALPPERFIGTELLKLRPEVNCVIHAHPPAQVLCSNIDIPLQPIVGSQNWTGAMLAARGVPVFPRALLIHTPELARLMTVVMSSRDATLLKAHGNVVVGRTIEEATVRCVALENLARLCWQIALTGRTPPKIPFEDIEDYVAQGLRAELPSGTRAFRYYEQLLEHGGRIDVTMTFD